jgi:hypothetical protein
VIELQGEVKVFVKATPDEGDKRGQPVGMLLTLTHPVAVADIAPTNLDGAINIFIKATPSEGDKRGQPVGLLLTLTHPVSTADLI